MPVFTPPVPRPNWLWLGKLELWSFLLKVQTTNKRKYLKTTHEVTFIYKKINITKNFLPKLPLYKKIFLFMALLFIRSVLQILATIPVVATPSTAIPPFSLIPPSFPVLFQTQLLSAQTPPTFAVLASTSTLSPTPTLSSQFTPRSLSKPSNKCSKPFPHSQLFILLRPSPQTHT